MCFHQTHRVITLNFLFCKALSYDLSVENLNKIFVLPDFFSIMLIEENSSSSFKSQKIPNSNLRTARLWFTETHEAEIRTNCDTSCIRLKQHDAQEVANETN